MPKGMGILPIPHGPVGKTLAAFGTEDPQTYWQDTVTLESRRGKELREWLQCWTGERNLVSAVSSAPVPGSCQFMFAPAFTPIARDRGNEIRNRREDSRLRYAVCISP